MAHKTHEGAVSKELSTETRRKLKALEDIAGLLSDLTPDELRAFLKATRRRPLFRNKPSK